MGKIGQSVNTGTKRLMENAGINSSDTKPPKGLPTQQIVTGGAANVKTPLKKPGRGLGQ